MRELHRQQRRLPSRDTHDPGYRRLRYARYADDHLPGFAGPKAGAEEIKARLAEFLRDDLKLELSEGKTLITHARTSAARFPGYEITVRHADHKLTRGRREVNGDIALRVPLPVIKAKIAPYMKHGKPAHRTRLMNDDDLAIISTYGAEYRGIVQYYLLAGDVWRLNRLRWAAETSLLKTLAAKHRSTVTKMAAAYGAVIATPHGPRRCFQASINRGEGRKPLVARFGGIPLKRQRKAVLTDRQPAPAAIRRKELITRLLGVPRAFRTVHPLGWTTWKGKELPRPKKSFSPEFKDEAVKMVIETSRPIARVAKELGINEGTLGNWVSIYRREHAGEEPPLTVNERARLRELERETREQKMELEFLKKAAAYFARDHR